MALIKERSRRERWLAGSGEETDGKTEGKQQVKKRGPNKNQSGL